MRFFKICNTSDVFVALIPLIIFPSNLKNLILVNNPSLGGNSVISLFPKSKRVMSFKYKISSGTSLNTFPKISNIFKWEAVFKIEPNELNLLLVRYNSWYINI